MVKKTVVLCEGVHDIDFLKVLLETNGETVMSMEWKYIVNLSSRNQELRLIDMFMSKNNNKTILLKGENGRDNCIDSFLELLFNNESDKYSLKMIIDSDNGKVMKLFRYRILEYTNKDYFMLMDGSDCIYTFKNTGVPVFYIYPGKDLESCCMEKTGLNLDHLRGGKKRQKYFRREIDGDLYGDWTNEILDFILG